MRKYMYRAPVKPLTSDYVSFKNDLYTSILIQNFPRKFVFKFQPDGYQSLKSNQRQSAPNAPPPLGSSPVPQPMVYDNRDNAVPNNNVRQPPVGRLIDLDDTPAAPMLDNPLSQCKYCNNRFFLFY